jgi:hypothetical protein
MRWIAVVLLAGAVTGCGSRAPADDFEARAFGAAYFQFPQSAINLQVSKASGRPVACGYARKMDGTTPEPGYPFVWADEEMQAGDRFYAMSEAQVRRLCGPDWPQPSRALGVSPAREAGTPAATGRSPAA